MPSDLKFKFAFDMNRWEEFFSYICLPIDWEGKGKSVKERKEKKGGYLEEEKDKFRDEERKKMSHEIDELLHRSKK